jgi:hypothetical protein
LENTYAYLPRRWGGEVEADQAITALRQAIAEAEKQEPVLDSSYPDGDEYWHDTKENVA